MRGYLILESGEIIEGEGLGKEGETGGEIVFNTSMTGYIEAITDPSYKGQILMFTYPLIGNYGVCKKDFQSDGPKVQAIVAKEICQKPSNWQSQESLRDFLIKFQIPAISNVDTRYLTKKIRTQGTMKAILKISKTKLKKIEIENLKKKVKKIPSISKMNLIETVSTKKIKKIKSKKGKYKLGILDCGVKKAILENLIKRGADLILLPYNFPAEKILKLKLDGLLISNGPGDPKRAKETIENTKKLIGKIPLFGICLGHQIIALALGLETFKLKFGHRGINQPVKDLKTKKVLITSQNHSFAVSEKGLKEKEIEITHLNLNDNTIEGLEHKRLKIKTCQFHPEASPGPHDAEDFFDEILEFLKNAKKKRH